MPERHTVEPFPNALANLMKERGIDQLRLSGLAKMNQSSVSRYLDGLRKPSLASMEKIAAALEVLPDFFLEYRIEKVKEIMEERPEVVSGVYDQFTTEAREASPDPGVVAALSEFWPMFVKSRSLCGYMRESSLGQTTFTPGPFYRAQSPYKAVELRRPLTTEMRSAHNRVASWTNENYLIRLWAILESHGFTKPIRQDARYRAEVKLLKRLRQHFAHGSGVYDNSKADHRALRRDILELFPKAADSPDGIPLSIDTVLKPMFERCRVYADDVLRLVDR